MTIQVRVICEVFKFKNTYAQGVPLCEQRYK